MPHVRPRTEAELAELASKVRQRLYRRFGQDRVSSFIMADPEVAFELVKPVFLAALEEPES